MKKHKSKIIKIYILRGNIIKGKKENRDI